MKEYGKSKQQRLRQIIQHLQYPEQFVMQMRYNYIVLDEKYLNLGDYILVFDNPDHDDYKYKKNSIQFEDVLRDFDKSFDVDSSFQSVNEELYRMGFFNTFDRLRKPPPGAIEIDRGQTTAGAQKQKLFIINEDGKQVRIKPDETRIMGGGDFLTYNGERNQWERTGNPVSDVATLFRIFLLYKVTLDGGFFIRQFLSLDGRKIFAVLFQEMRNLQIEAQRTFLKKRINIAFCDILSLEPVDEAFRPLRFSKVVRSDPRELPLQFKEYQKEVQKLLKSIDFSKLARECNQPPYEASGEIQEQRPITADIVQAYIFYLEQVAIEINKVRKKFKVEDYRKILTPQELKLLIANQRESNYKSKSSKQYVRDQVNGDELESNKRKIKVYLQRKKAQEIEELLRKAKHETDKLYGKKLQNLWDRLGATPQGPYLEYFYPRRNQNFNQFINQDSIWTFQVINEKGEQSLFSKMERAKLNTSILKQIVNLEYINAQDYIYEYLIPNSYFDLDGQKYKGDFYQPLKQASQYNQDLFFSMKLVTLVKEKFRRFIEKDLNEQDNTKKKKKQDIQGGLNGDNLLNLWGLLEVPVQPIGDYYGERVALYFMFLQYFVTELLGISYFGILTFIVQLLYDVDRLANKMAIIFFTIMIVFWSSTFQSLWIRQEMQFQTMFGLEEIETDQIELVGFVGRPKRSIATDKLNELQYSSKETWLKFFFNLFLVLIFVVIEIIIIVALQFLSLELEKNPDVPVIDFVELSVFIPALIWVFIGILLDNVYRPFAFFLTKWENHKYLSQFETSFIIKNLLFSTVNRLGQPFIIAFFYQNTIGCVDDNYCYSQLQVYMRVVFIIEFGKHILFGFIFPILKQIYQKARFGLVSIVEFGEPLQKKTPYYHFNKALETEIQKESFTIDQVDGTIWEYLELNLQFALLANFGSPFPLIFITGLAMNCFELFLDKFKLIWMTKRPIPQTARTIGPFIYYMNLISYISIFINSGLLSYSNQDVFTDINSFTLFAILMICFFLFKFITDQVYSNSDTGVEQVRLRHKQIKRRLHVGMRSKQQNTSHQSFPIAKIYGTLLPHQYKKQD